MISISVVVLAYNEEQSLKRVVRELVSVLTTLGRQYEVIIVDDGSTDGTGQIADKLAREIESVSIIHHETNKGLGEGYKTGFGAVQGDFVTFFAADGQSPATIIKQFLPLMDNADMVLGYLPNRSSSLVAKGLSKAERILYALLFGPLPKFQGVTMFRRTLLKELELKSPGGRGWAVLMELIIRASRDGYRLVSVPTELRARMSGESKVNNLSTIWANVKQAIALYRYL